MSFELFLQVIGVAQVINKRGFLDHTFTREDEKVFKKTGLISLCIKLMKNVVNIVSCMMSAKWYFL